MKGLVIKNTGSWYTVLTDDGQLLDCKVKGNFRIKGIRSTNPVAVGDHVTVGEGNWITEAYRVPVILIFNKVDVLNDDELHYQQMMIDLYETIGYECRAISAETGVGVEELRPLLEGKITLLSGNSGVGKSTLINRLVPHANQRTAEISDAHQTGMHTTTFSEMIPLTTHPSPLTSHHSPLTSKSWLIDTPGIKGFGTFDMEREELTSYFKEIFEFSKQCRFSDCTHTHEPGCAVLKAVEDHYIAQSRYQSYLSMLDDKDENKYREAY